MRPLPLVALALVAGSAVPGRAAPKPQITDPVGDVLLVGAHADVVHALFRTEGRTERVGKHKVYTPTKLVVTVTYAADVPLDEPATARVVAFDTTSCLNVYLETYNGTTYGSADCLGQETFEFTARAKGRTMTFSLPFAMIGSQHLRRGARLTSLRTYTALADPVIGYETGEAGGETGAGPVDDARSAATFVIG